MADQGPANTSGLPEDVSISPTPPWFKSLLPQGPDPSLAVYGGVLNQAAQGIADDLSSQSEALVAQLTALEAVL